MEISNAVNKELKEKGYKTLQTRKGDVKNVGERLKWRIDKAEGSSMFVSIHVNANKNENAKGFEVYYNSEGKELAESINNEVSIFSRKRGIKENNSLYVLRKFEGPSADSQNN